MRLLWLVVPVIWTVPLEAQTVRGQLVDSISRSPLSGAFLTLVDQQGVERARAITNDAGEFVLVAPTAGTYHASGHRDRDVKPCAERPGWKPGLGKHSEALRRF